VFLEMSRVNHNGQDGGIVSFDSGRAVDAGA
jgi:hypothetical protein